MNSSTRFETAGEWVLRLSEDSVSSAEIAEWTQWCAADPKNLEAFEELQSMWQSARAQPPAPSILTRLMQAGPPPRLARSWLPLAASLAALAIASGAFVGLTRRAEDFRRVADVEQVRTPIAHNEQALLPDGSRVDVAARTALDVAFSSTQRHLKLHDGQAFFDVRRDKNRPFIVDAGDIQIRAIGTAFDVRRSPVQTAVTVQEGVIEVTAGTETLRATAGQQLVFDIESQAVHQSNVDTAVPLSWRSGSLEFTGDPLLTVIASANRYSPHPIVLANAELGRLTFTGALFTDSIEASLDALEQVFPIEVEREGNDIVLRARR